MKFIRTFLVILAVAIVGASVFLFFETERKYYALSEVEPRAQAIYSSWLEQNNCNENLEPCIAYTEQFTEWRSQMEQHRQRKMQRLEFQCYLFLKELDEQHIPDLNSGGLASLAAACAVFLLVVFLLVYLLGGQKKSKNPYIRAGSLKREPTFRQTGIAPKQTKYTQVQASVQTNPKARALLRKAVECAESGPMQSISYLEQAIEDSLGTKLSTSALLLCGGLRLKNKIGEKQGREQLKRVISVSPQSLEAKKAQVALDTYK